MWYCILISNFVLVCRFFCFASLVSNPRTPYWRTFLLLYWTRRLSLGLELSFVFEFGRASSRIGLAEGFSLFFRLVFLGGLPITASVVVIDGCWWDAKDLCRWLEIARGSDLRRFCSDRCCCCCFGLLGVAPEAELRRCCLNPLKEKALGAELRRGCLIGCCLAVRCGNDSNLSSCSRCNCCSFCSLGPDVIEAPLLTGM